VTSFCRAWFGVAYVRMQAFERDSDAADWGEGDSNIAWLEARLGYSVTPIDEVA